MRRGLHARLSDDQQSCRGKAKERSAELWQQRRRGSHEIGKDPARMRTAERKGIAPQVRKFVRQAERERRREKGRGVVKDEGVER
jgi:hypothetical protein